MIQSKEDLDNAIWAGGKEGGQYLDKIGKTDLATLTKEEYFMFCQAVCTKFIVDFQGDFIPL